MNEFKFLLSLGISLSWLGYIPSNFSLTSTSAIYSIDNQTTISFFVPALSAANAPTLLDQVFSPRRRCLPNNTNSLLRIKATLGQRPLYSPTSSFRMRWPLLRLLLPAFPVLPLPHLPVFHRAIRLIWAPRNHL